MKNKLFKAMLALFVSLLCTSCGRFSTEEETPENTIEINTGASEAQVQTYEQIQTKTEAEPASDAMTALDNLQKAIDTYIPGIVCWGDSLTVGAGSDVGYPDVLRELINSEITSGTGCEIPVVMMGVGGENSYTIAARAGGIPIILSTDFTIPAECISVQIDFLTEDGHVFEPMLQGDEGVEYVEIAGVRGTLEYLPDVTGTGGKNFIYYFKRLEAGEAVAVPAGTVMYTRGYLEYKDYLPIIFIGENGGYSGYDELIRQQMSIVNTGRNTERFLIIGLTTGTAQDRAELENAMEERYGGQYLNARSMLSSDGMGMMEIETTVFDKMMIDEGKVPGRLLSDSVHLNEPGYRALGYMVYERMTELGYFDEVLKAAEEYRNFNE